MITLLVLLFALLLDYVLVHTHYLQALEKGRLYLWVGAYLNWIGRHFRNTAILHQGMGILLVLLPLPILFFLVSRLIGNSSVVKLIFDALVLVFCLKPISDTSDYSERIYAKVDGYYAILFWYVFAGTPGIVLYRLISELVLKLNTQISDFSAIARLTAELAAWIPARITAFLFALAGSYTSTYQCWRIQVMDSQLTNKGLLFDCAKAALAQEGFNRSNIESLLDRTLLIWLILLIFGVIY